jgi:hypothetical protein
MHAVFILATSSATCGRCKRWNCCPGTAGGISGHVNRPGGPDPRRLAGAADLPQDAISPRSAPLAATTSAAPARRLAPVGRARGERGCLYPHVCAWACAEPRARLIGGQYGTANHHQTAFDILGIAERVVPAEADYTPSGIASRPPPEIAALSTEPGTMRVPVHRCARAGGVPGRHGRPGPGPGAGGVGPAAIPAQQYAVFACTMGTLSATYAAIYGQWLPASGYQLQRAGGRLRVLSAGHGRFAR